MKQTKQVREKENKNEGNRTNVGMSGKVGHGHNYHLRPHQSEHQLCHRPGVPSPCAARFLINAVRRSMKARVKSRVAMVDQTRISVLRFWVLWKRATMRNETAKILWR